MSDWKEVKWIEAANAVAAGTHEYEASSGRPGGWAKNCGFHPDKDWFYRIREKVRTITVTHVRPLSIACSDDIDLMLLFDNATERNTAYDAIRAAMSGGGDGE